MLKTNLREIFNESQTLPLRKAISKAKEAKDYICSNDEGLQSFIEIINIILLDKNKEISSNVYSLVKSIIKSFNEDVGGHFFSKKICEHLIETLNCKFKKVRRKTMILLSLFTFENKILSKISESLFDKDKSVRRECIKLLSSYQNEKIAGKSVIKHLIKDLAKHDPNFEVRKEALKTLEIIKDNYSTLISRSADVNISIRKYFFDRVFDSLDLKLFSSEEKYFILKVVYSERGFDTKIQFIKKIKDAYSNDHILFVEDFYDKSVEEELKECLKHLFSEIELVIEEGFIKNLNFHSAFVFYEHLKYINERLGRDAIELPPLNDFLEFVYKKSKEALVNKEMIPFLRYLLKILSFFEILNYENYKIIQAMIYNLLGKNFLEEIVDDIFILPNISTDLNFLGSLIKKNEENDKILILCRSIFKNVSFSELHHAILNEILFKFKNKQQFYEVLFYAILKEQNEEFLNHLLFNLSDTFVFLTDLYLNETFMSRIKDKLFPFLENELNSARMDVIKSLCKILLKERSTFNLNNLLTLFYAEKNEESTQFLSVFFYEFFNENNDILINNFCTFLKSIPINKHRIFIDQTLYWLNSSNTDLFTYNILLFIYKNIGVNLRTLLKLLNLISFEGNNITLLKKIRYISQLLHKRNIDLKVLEAKINSFTNEEEIEDYVIKQVKDDLDITY
ncbi:hypothetical protein H312_03349 [Anncaliia algerae PRA339]|uniref:Condensin complex subunit 1 C-terminal domain-containing protein n=1 Tax=Anncaliia algerae PRA339 TaxID=1288291 RepID=A0A059EWZ2_9MICR|nr:hypothetical protein H312_03349 [Anncaliia algerae PRA339]